MSSSHNCFRLREFFSTIWCISGVASFLDNPNAIISEYYSFSTFNSCSPNLTGESFKYPLISSWSLRSHVSKILNSLKYLHSFSNSSRCFFIFSSFIFNSYGGLFKISLPPLSYQIFVVSKFQRWFHQDLLKVCAISLLILSMRISSMSYPLLGNNLIWWRISIQ